MPFQSTVSIDTGFGVPGELFTDSPWRVQSWTLSSTTSSLNIVGATAYTSIAVGVAQAGNTNATPIAFAGILADPKNYALYGAGGIALAPTLQIPNNAQAELATMGTMVVSVLSSSANIGDYLIYDDTTGALTTMAPASECTDGYSFANGVVDYFSTSQAGLCVVTLSPVINPIPTNE